MSPEDFDALLALYGARLYLSDIQNHMMVVDTKKHTAVFINGDLMKPDNAAFCANLASRSTIPLSNCRSHPWKPAQ